MAGDTTNRLAGTAYVTVNGVTVMVEGSFKYQAAPARRESTAYVLERASYGRKDQEHNSGSGLPAIRGHALQDAQILHYASPGRLSSSTLPPGVRHPLMKPYPSRLP